MARKTTVKQKSCPHHCITKKGYTERKSPLGQEEVKKGRVQRDSVGRNTHTREIERKKKRLKCLMGGFEKSHSNPFCP
jgi:hypothetical protein